VPTRNRPTQIPECVESLLATGGYQDIFVIDQSDDTGTEESLAKFKDPRFHYVHTETRGVTISRNLGIELSSGDIIAYTDDDCRATSDWAKNIARIFAADPQVAVVFGRVRIPDEVWTKGYVLGFEPKVRVWQRRYPPPDSDWGMTANAAIRRSALDVVGDFDPVLGAGAPLISGEEPDFIYRVLRAGYKVVNASEVVVDHFGARTPGREVQRLIRGYAIGTGAAFWKHVRLGDRQALGIYLDFIGVSVRAICMNLMREHRPQGVGFLMAFVSGALQSYRFRIDRQRRQYLPPSQPHLASLEHHPGRNQVDSADIDVK
jgi:glycosyltransferase involved in cell wall biosynthesis